MDVADATIHVMEARGIRVAIGDKVLLDGVDLRIAPGRVTALLGPNGAGKSTMLKVLSGSLRPGAGEVRLNGRPLAEWDPGECARLRAVLLQDQHLPFAFTVEEVALMGRYPHAPRRETARDLEITRSCLAATDTLSLADRLYPTLSGGEKQRTHWARVLAQLDAGEPGNGGNSGNDGHRANRGDSLRGSLQGSLYGKCLLLDEPTSSLDLAHQHALLERTRRLAEAGAGVLVILHDLNLAAQYADTLVLLHAGRVAAAGSPEDVLTPARLREVYGVRAGVAPHPDSGKPQVFIRANHNAGDAEASRPREDASVFPETRMHQCAYPAKYNRPEIHTDFPRFSPIL